jgi:translation initiation factor 2 gamma subunit (eIF-2gamma)
MTALGTVTRKLAGNDYELSLKYPVVIEKGQIVAVSKRVNMQWRLVAYGISK